MRRLTRAPTLLIAVLLVAGCRAAATPVPTPAPTRAPTPTPDPCAAAVLQTVTPGKLTVGADNPAYPPYFQPDPSNPPWELGNPANGKGLEGATALAVARALGFTADQVVWKPISFNNAIQPGKKDFDMFLTRVSYSAERAQAVDLSDGYFDLNQAVLGLKDNPIAKVTTVAGLKDFKFGTQVATSSFRYIVNNIKPTKEPKAYD